MASILLVRHGETTWNREGRVQGWADTALSGLGREQARLTGEHLAGAFDVDRIVASDLRRAQETTHLLRDSGLPVVRRFDRAWRERDFGDYQGLDRASVAEHAPAFDADGSAVAIESAPGGESLDEFCRRIVSGWESLLAGLDDGETVAVVTHGGPIRTVVADVTGRDVPTLAREWSPGNCGVTEFEVADGAVHSVVRRDDCAHLD